MKGLFRQSAAGLGKTILVYAVAVALFSAMNAGSSVLYFWMAYALMVPVSLMSQDEMAGFDRLCMMMPVKPVAYVLHKFLLAWAMMGVALIGAAVIGAVDDRAPMMLAVSLITSAFALTLMMHTGFHKSRWVYLAAVILQVVVMSAVDSVMTELGLTSPAAMNAAMLAVAVIVSAAAVPMAARLFERRMTA